MNEAIPCVGEFHTNQPYRQFLVYLVDGKRITLQMGYRVVSIEGESAPSPERRRSILRRIATAYLRSERLQEMLL